MRLIVALALTGLALPVAAQQGTAGAEIHGQTAGGAHTPFAPGCDPVSLTGAAPLLAQRDCHSPQNVHGLATMRIDAGGTMRGRAAMSAPAGTHVVLGPGESLRAAASGSYDDAIVFSPTVPGGALPAFATAWFAIDGTLVGSPGAFTGGAIGARFDYTMSVPGAPSHIFGGTFGGLDIEQGILDVRFFGTAFSTPNAHFARVHGLLAFDDVPLSPGALPGTATLAYTLGLDLLAWLQNASSTGALDVTLGGPVFTAADFDAIDATRLRAIQAFDASGRDISALLLARRASGEAIALGTPIPEPATWTLTALGLAALATVARRRGARAASAGAA